MPQPSSPIKGILLAALMAFVVGGGVCTLGFALTAIPPNLFGSNAENWVAINILIMMSAIPAGIITFLYKIVRLIKQRRAAASRLPENPEK